MSRLSGFIIEHNGEEVFSISWKNYLSMDGLIWKFSYDNKLNLNVIDDFKMFFRNYAAFEQVALMLGKKVEHGFSEDDIMSREPADAQREWDYLINLLFDFLDSHTDAFLETCSYEFFSCD